MEVRVVASYEEARGTSKPSSEKVYKPIRSCLIKRNFADGACSVEEGRMWRVEIEERVPSLTRVQCYFNRE
ncbi:hypothetical protein TNCV_2334431 [Trichonephila clavipes]|nr:hypothetical protein TNCV_2334431 [Trichonephila clavipes]